MISRFRNLLQNWKIWSSSWTMVLNVDSFKKSDKKSNVAPFLQSSDTLKLHQKLYFSNKFICFFALFQLYYVLSYWFMPKKQVYLICFGQSTIFVLASQNLCFWLLINNNNLHKGYSAKSSKMFQDKTTTFWQPQTIVLESRIYQKLWVFVGFVQSSSFH